MTNIYAVFFKEFEWNIFFVFFLLFINEKYLYRILFLFINDKYLLCSFHINITENRAKESDELKWWKM